MGRAYQVLAAKGSLRDDLELVTTFEEFNRIVQLDEHYRLEARYADAERQPAAPRHPDGAGPDSGGTDGAGAG